MNTILWMDARGAEHLRTITGGCIRVAGYHPLRLWRWVRRCGIDREKFPEGRGAPFSAARGKSAAPLTVRHRNCGTRY